VSDDEVPEDIERVAAAALTQMDRSEAEVSILLCRDPYIHELNRIHRNQDKPTDVLSFSQTDAQEGYPTAPPVPGEVTHLGDIVVSVDSVRRNAEEWEIPYRQELRRVVVHGVLHLLGMDHSTNDPDQEMLLLQERLLAAISEEHEL
jgi:probable rRNA maturation factor